MQRTQGDGQILIHGWLQSMPDFPRYFAPAQPRYSPSFEVTERIDVATGVPSAALSLRTG